MKWRAPSRRVQMVLAAPVLVPVLVFVVPLFLMLTGFSKLGRAFDRRFGLTAEWTEWFAWRPVRINDWFDAEEGRWVWLESVERRRDRGVVEYRTAGRIDP